MIAVESVSKRFGDFTALDDISFEIHAGEILVHAVDLLLELMHEFYQHEHLVFEEATARRSRGAVGAPTRRYRTPGDSSSCMSASAPCTVRSLW